MEFENWLGRIVSEMARETKQLSDLSSFLVRLDLLLLSGVAPINQAEMLRSRFPQPHRQVRIACDIRDP